MLLNVNLLYSDCEYGFLQPLHYGIATPPSQRLRVRLAAGSLKNSRIDFSLRLFH
jgi:hypothetical protein